MCVHVNVFLLSSLLCACVFEGVDVRERTNINA